MNKQRFFAYLSIGFYCLVAILSFAETQHHSLSNWYRFACDAAARAKDSTALVKIYNATNGSKWTLTSKWDFTKPISTWTGITFSSADCRVTAIKLNSSGLDGTLPTEIGDLTALTSLDLADNKIAGKVPDELTKLVKLQKLYLNKNLLTAVPDMSKVTTLVDVKLESNKLDFSYLELYSKITAFTYTPQDSIGTAQTITVNDGDKVELTTFATAGGKNGVFEWFKDGNSTGVPKSDNSSLRFDDVRTTNAGEYVLKITNSSLGALGIFTKKITLKVNPCYISNNTVEKSATVCEGDTLPTLKGSEAKNAKDPLRYQWQLSADKKKTWVDADTSKDYRPKAISDTTFFRRVAYDNRCKSDTSNIIQLNFVKKIQNNKISNLQSQIICKGDSAKTFIGTTPTGGGGKYTYQWQSSSDKKIWSNELKSKDFKPLNITTTTYFRRLVQGACSVDSGTVVEVTVFPSFQSNKIIGDQTICPNGAVVVLKDTTIAFTSVDVKNFKYAWQKSFDNKKWARADTLSKIDSVPEFTPKNISQKTYFRRVISGLCGGDTSNTVTIDMFEAIRNNVVSTDKAVTCEKDSILPNLVGTEVLGGGGNYNYVWQSSLDSLNWADRFTSASFTSVSLTDDTYFRRIVNSACYSDTSNVVKLKMVFDFGANSIGTSQIVCAGSKLDSLEGNSQKGKGNFEFEWQFSPDSINWKPFDTLGTNKNFIPDTLVYPITFFRRAVKGGCQISYSNIVYIENVQALSNNRIRNDNQTICEGELFMTVIATTPTGGGGGYKYQWQNSTDSTNWVLADTNAYLQPARIRQTTLYRRIVSANECNPDTSSIIKITVVNKIGNNKVLDNQEICEGVAADTLVGSVPTGGLGHDSTFVYIWQATTDSVWRNVAATRSYAPNLVNTSTKYRRIVMANNCFTDTSKIVEVRVNEKIRNNDIIEGRQTICKGSLPDTLKASLPIDGVGLFLYQWQTSSDRKEWKNIADATGQDLKAASPDTTTYYRRIAANQCFSDTSASEVVTVLPLPNVSAGVDTVVNIGQSVRLIPKGALRYQWEKHPSIALADSTSATPLVTPSVTTLYTVIGTDSRGCSNKSSVWVRVKDDPIVHAVEVITPNGDGLNDNFYIENLEAYPDNLLIIFNRWGKQIAQFKDYKNDWDGVFEGSPLPTGVYFYVLTFKISDRVKKGSFSILNN